MEVSIMLLYQNIEPADHIDLTLGYIRPHQLTFHQSRRFNDKAFEHYTKHFPLCGIAITKFLPKYLIGIPKGVFFLFVKIDGNGHGRTIEQQAIAGYFMIVVANAIKFPIEY